MLVFGPAEVVAQGAAEKLLFGVGDLRLGRLHAPE